MAHSFADRPTLPCPECGHTFAPELWLIIDAAERPDLLARVRDGSIHHVVCPHGHTSAADAALLIYRPGQSPPVLFSPAKRTTVEQDRGIAAGLIDHLRQSLRLNLRDRMRHAWREEWLGDVLPIPRAVLPAVLEGATPEVAVAADLAAAIPPDVRRALDEITAALAAEGVSVNSPEALQAALATRPELAARLAAGFGDPPPGDGPGMPAHYRENLRRAGEADARYQTHGDPAALDEAAAAWERVLGSPDFSHAPQRFQLGAFNDAAIVLMRRYQVYGRRGDLDRALALWQKVAGQIQIDSPERAIVLNNLGAGLRDRYALTGRAEDLDAAVSAYKEAVQLTPDDAPERAAILNSLGVGLRDRYALIGSPADLDVAIAALEAAVRLTPDDSPDLGLYLNSLGNGLSDRYRRTGSADDLDAAVAALQGAVRRTATTSPDWPVFLHNLGNGLSDRYARLGDLTDLDAAVAALEEAIRFTPDGAPDKPLILNSLGSVLNSRYARKGRVDDLDAAIATFQEAVRRTPANSPDRAMTLSSLGTGLQGRYARTGQMEALHAANTAYAEAVQLTPFDSPARSGRLSNLGSGLSEQYERTGRVEDLDAAIAVWEEAVRHAPSGAPDRAMYLSQLGSGLRARYARRGDPADLDAAVAALEEAVRLAPSGAPDRTRYLSNLGGGLRDRYARTRRPEALDAAIATWQEAIQDTPNDVPAWANRLNNLGTGLYDRYELLGRGDDLDTVIRLWEEVIHRTPVGSPNLTVYLTNLSLGQHARYARAGRGEDLDAALAHARAACLAAGETAGENALRAARAWAGLALQRGHWAEAQDAAARGRATLQRLNEVNVLAGERASWLKEAQGLAAAEAYALTRGSLQNGAEAPDYKPAVLALETGQAQTLNAALGRGRDRARLADLRGDDPPLFAAYQAAADAVRAAQRLGAGGATPAGDGPGPQPTVDEARRRVVATQAALDAVIARVRARPGYADLFAPLAFDDVAAAVGAAPLAYLATTPGGSVVLLLHRRGEGVAAEALWADLTADELDRLLIRRAVAAGNVGPVAGGLLPAQVSGFGLGPELAATLPVLGARLLAPLAARLRALGATAVTLIPGGRLNLLPLHAATYMEEGAPRAFLDEFAVTFAPSAEVAGRAQGSRGAGQQGSGWQPLRAVEEGAPPRPPGEGWGEGSSALVVGNPRPLPPGVASLRFAREEATTVAGLYRDRAAFAGRVAFLPEAAATHDAVSAALPGRAVLHFACHGTFDSAAPLDSGLLLANGEMLTLRQVRETAALAGARLVVLSACQTGLTDFRELPDEVIGLPAGFLEAGAAGVVGSLWPVDDRSTALLMGDFHRRALAGQPPAEALRAAQRWLRGATRAELGAYYEAHIRQMSAAEAFAAQGQMVGGGPPDEAPYAAPTHWAAFTFNGA